MHRLVLGNTFMALVAPILLLAVVVHLLNKMRASAQRNEEDLNPGMPSPPILPSGNGYEVFLSFRGVDTRKGFADHLYCSLVDAGISVFRDDDELHQGEKLSPNLHKAIENSKIIIPIISENYASSKWCLNELIHMMEYQKHLGHKVLPIFYKVGSADVRYQKGSFGEAFHYYHSWKNYDQKLVEKWTQALGEVASLRGLESEKVANGHERELVKLVVRKVMKKLKTAVIDYLVRIDSHVEDVMGLVNKSSGAALRVGIYGMGGIGKTTLAKVIYDELSDSFVHRSFIADIRESCNRYGINYLQNQLIFDMQKEKLQFRNSDQGIMYMSSRFKNKKVLIILDDVDHTNQLKALAGNPDWFGPGSRIFITTRNESVLDMAGVDIKYEHKEMDEKQSLILFSKHAFRRDSPPSEFSALSRLVVSITGGLPLAIEVVGSFLCGKPPPIWRETIKKMQNVPLMAVQEKLRISYEDLGNDQRQMFLDIACFLIGSDARIASYMWDACGFYTVLGIEKLRSLSLVKIGDNHEFRMHDQIRDLGRGIVRAESYYEAHKCSRLWDYGEALEVLLQSEGTETIQAICLEKGNTTRIADEGSRILTNEQFKKLPGLRILHMNDVNLIGDFNEIFSQLRWLKWGNCSPTFAANNFHPRELVILELSGSSISEDWQGWSSMKMAQKLKVLNLTGCRSLKRTIHLSAFYSLEILILRYCGKLELIDPCIGGVKTLVSLDLRGCWRLKELPPQMGKLERLKELLLDQTMIREIPSSIGFLEKLETLSAKDCKLLCRLPDSIGRLVNLRCLSLGHCHELREIPDSIEMLKLLTQLDLRGCCCLKELPPQMGKLEQLKELFLDQTMIRKIPSSIGLLEKLETLSAKDCKLLCRLPGSIGRLVNLRCLSLGRCHGLREIPNSIGMLKLLTRLNLSRCLRLEELPAQMGELEQLKELLLDQTVIREIPSSFGSLKKLETLSAKDCQSLVRLPDSISCLVNLRCLSLGRCHGLREIPNSIGMLKLLTRLDLSGCSCLEELPPQMGELEQLKELLLDQTVIRKIPSSFGSLKKLETLSAKDCKSLLALPDSIGRLVNLSTLVLLGCVELVALPDSIGALQNLEILNISRTKIKELPSGIGRLRNLRDLDASWCTELRGEVSESIRNLSSLQRLDFRGCDELLSLCELPSGLTYLSVTCQSRSGNFFLASFKLEILQILDCKFMESLDVSQLHHLRKLSVEFCNKILEVRGLGKLKYLENLTITNCDLIKRLDFRI